ncbi:MAG: ATP-binding protein, partial [Gemmatimonadaceae bacterium]|nr:ATP-binding protein [Gemmatimonadaceae bacterium]
MTTPILDQLTAHCQALRLHRVGPLLPTLLEQAAQQELSYSDFLATVLATEAAAKAEKSQAMRIQMARFPFQKSLDGFDFKAQPSI